MKDQAILSLLQATFGRHTIPTIQTQNSDNADFHEVAIWDLVTLVKKAYEAGRDTGYREGLEAAQDMASHYAKECGE